MLLLTQTRGVFAAEAFTIPSTLNISETIQGCGSPPYWNPSIRQTMSSALKADDIYSRWYI